MRKVYLSRETYQFDSLGIFKILRVVANTMTHFQDATRSAVCLCYFESIASLAISLFIKN